MPDRRALPRTSEGSRRSPRLARARERLMTALWQPAGLTLLVLTTVVCVATSVYMTTEGWSALTALSFVLQTVTTIGYGNIYPQSHAGRIFTVGMMVFGFVGVAVALSTLAARLINAIERGTDPMQRNEQALQGLSGHLVVAAAGGLVGLIMQSLQAEGIAFAAITQDESLHERWLADELPNVLGNPDDEEALRRAGIERASGLIVALDSDADNVFVALSAHDLNPGLRIVARAHSASAISKLRHSGADEVILPDQITAISLVDQFRTRERPGSLARQATEELRQELQACKTDQPSIAQGALFRALRLAIQELSPEMEEMLFAIGQQFGRDALAPNLTDGGLPNALKELPRLWSSAGLGSIRIVSSDEQAAVIEEMHCATCEGLANAGKPMCHLERGVIAGALEERLGRTVRVTETKCWGMGSQGCEFTITADTSSHA